MKRLLLLAVILIMAFCGIAQANESSSVQSSGLLNASAVIIARPARLSDIAVYTDGTHNATVTCYDNATTNTGSIVGQATVLGSEINGGDSAPLVRRTASGIYCALSGTGASMIIYFDVQ